MSTVLKDFNLIIEELQKCMQCGNCQNDCPVYVETKDEGAAARGKIRLSKAILEGKLTYTKELADKIGLCLTCKNCVTKCPCGVDFGEVILAARAAVAQNKGLHPIKKTIFQVMDRPGLFNFGLTAGSIFQGVVFKKHVETEGMQPRFPFGLDMKKVMPTLAKVPFKKTVDEVTKVTKPKYKVLFFPGCSANFLYADAAKATHDILVHMGCEVIVPKKQHCCGLPVLTHGDIKVAADMAKYNLSSFKNYEFDYFITMCGSCGSNFKHHNLTLLKDANEFEYAKELAAKVKDISEFLIDVLKVKPRDFGPVSKKITYHDPCHLNRGMGISKQPREIFNMIPGIDFEEMSNPSRCCGGAGSFMITHPELSMDIHKKKISMIKETGADTLVTGCGGCMMQYTDGKGRFGENFDILHTTQIIAEAIKNK